MSYPPQQPGQYGGQPYDPYGQQPSYQGMGGYPPGGPGGYPGGLGEPPKKSNTGMIIAVVVIALLVLGGGGVGVYVLTKGDDKSNTGSGTTTSTKPKQTSKGGEPTGRSSDDSEPTSEDNNGGGSDDPDAVVDAYVEAYETKSFGSVVNNACDAYKDKFGVDTSKLEQDLEPYEVAAEADGPADVSGSTASALIDLELSKDGKTQTPKIKIKIVKQDGAWKFCGEESA